MKNKKKMIKVSLTTILIVIIILGGYFGYQKIYLPSQKENTVEIYGDDNLLVDEVVFKKNSYIQILDENEKTVDKLELSQELEKLTLEKAEDSDQLFFDTWEIEKKVDEEDKIYFVAKPLYEDKEGVLLTFITDQKSTLVSNEKEIKYVRKLYKEGVSLTDYLPDVVIKENFKNNFKGKWMIKDTDKDQEINEETEIKNDTTLEFKTYQDKNNNEVDDFTEEFTVSFVTNLDEEKEDRKVKWEETIDLQDLKDDKKIFYEWYSDEEFKEKFTENIKITDDITLYAKIRDFEEVINNTINDPIDRKDIALQVQKIIDQRSKEVDLNYNREIEEREKEREELKKHNEENNVIMQDREVEINFHNTDHNKLHLITFLDTSNNFIYSLVAPYGQTIKILNENGNLVKEYGIRQNTTIILDKKILVSNTGEFEKYHSEYRQINDTIFIVIQPEKK